MSIRHVAVLALIAISKLSLVSSFAPNNYVEVATTSKKTFKNALQMQTTGDEPSLSTTYGEESRKFRRTVYTHDDWVKHRSPDRLISNLSSMVKSGIYKNVAKEVLATTAIASFITIWNVLCGDSYVDLAGVVHASPLKDTILPIIALPLTPFTLASPSLGLLLGEFVYCI